MPTDFTLACLDLPRFTQVWKPLHYGVFEVKVQSQPCLNQKLKQFFITYVDTFLSSFNRIVCSLACLQIR